MPFWVASRIVSNNPIHSAIVCGYGAAPCADVSCGCSRALVLAGRRETRAVLSRRSPTRWRCSNARSAPDCSSAPPAVYRLTDEGEVLLVHADAIAERFALARRPARHARRRQRGRRCASARFPTALAGLVPAAIARVRLRYPDTKVAIDEGTDGLPARVRSGELHLAIAFQDTALPRREPPGLERRDLFRERFLVALAPGHRLAERRQVGLAELSDEDWTVATTDGLIVAACRAAGFEPNLVSITRDQLAIRALIARGLAVTLAPGLLAEAFKDLVLRPDRRRRPRPRRLRPAATRRPPSARRADARRARHGRRGTAGTPRLSDFARPRGTCRHSVLGDRSWRRDALECRAGSCRAQAAGYDQPR